MKLNTIGAAIVSRLVSFFSLVTELNFRAQVSSLTASKRERERVRERSGVGPVLP